MPEDMPEDMPDRMPDRMPEDMSDRMPEDMPDRMPEDLPDRMPEDMPDRMPEDMSDRMPQDLPVRKCINVMVGITRSKVFFFTVVFNMIWWNTYQDPPEVFCPRVFGKWEYDDDVIQQLMGVVNKQEI